MAEVTTVKRIEKIIENALQESTEHKGFFVIQSSDFDNSDIVIGENHWRDFSLNVKKNLGAEIVNLKEGHEDELKSKHIVDILKVNFNGCLFGELKPFDLEKNRLDLCLGIKDKTDFGSLEKILKKKNFEFRKNSNEKQIFFDLIFKDSKIRISPMDYENAIKKLNELRKNDSENSNVLNISFSLFYEYDEQLKRNSWLPRKVFHSFEFIRNSGYYFGERMIDYAEKNDAKKVLIYGIQRGGSSLANCISEKIKKDSRLNVDVGVIIASSYINMTKEELELKYIVPNKSKATAYDLVLIVDDLVDTGTTIKNVIEGFDISTRKKIKTCVLDFKDRTYKMEKKLFPDYLRLKININSHKEEIWIVYDGELEGLTKKEEEYLYGNKFEKYKLH